MSKYSFICIMATGAAGAPARLQFVALDHRPRLRPGCQPTGVAPQLARGGSRSLGRSGTPVCAALGCVSRRAAPLLRGCQALWGASGAEPPTPPPGSAARAVGRPPRASAGAACARCGGRPSGSSAPRPPGAVPVLGLQPQKARGLRSLRAVPISEFGPPPTPRRRRPRLQPQNPRGFRTLRAAAACPRA